MGSFIVHNVPKPENLPEEKIQQHIRDCRVIYRAGGMMSVKVMTWKGKAYSLLSMLDVNSSERFGCGYNYFDDLLFESTGVNGQGEVWSDKVSGRGFIRCIIAGLIMQGSLSDAPFVITLDGDPMHEQLARCWLRWLFPDRAPGGKIRLWDAFSAYTELDEERWSRVRFTTWDEWTKAAAEVVVTFGNMRSRGSIYSCVHGTAALDEVLEELAARNEDFEYIQHLRDSIVAQRKRLEEYMRSSDQSTEERLETIMNAFEIAGDMQSKAEDDTCVDFLLARFVHGAVQATLMPYTAKLLSETFGKPLAEIWDRLPERLRYQWGERDEKAPSVRPLSTEVAFQLSPDDMLPYWTKKCPLDISEELQEWFHSLAARHQDILQNLPQKDRPVDWMMDLLDEADWKYYQIYAFSNFVEESINNPGDPRRLALWHLFEELINDPRLTAIGKKIFRNPHEERPADEEARRSRSMRELKGFTYGGAPRNEARDTIRRYLALCANEELRETVFGF